MSRIEADEVKRAAAGRWGMILTRLSPQLGEALSRAPRHGQCPVHGGRDGFRLFRDVAETGGGVCATCGTKADGFALLMWANGWGFRETLEAVAEVLGFRVDAPGPRAPAPPEGEGRAEKASRVTKQRAEAARRVIENVRASARLPGEETVKL